tara:strand:+ start:5576 stop:5938 length:363 start_codon:yes stop_codon:yes gene_type:complete
MLLIIIICYIILLIIIESIFIFYNYKNKKYISFTDIDHVKLKNTTRLIYKETENDINLQNYTGKFLLYNYFGFFIHNNKWYIIHEKKEYDFIYPIDIIIIKSNHKKIEYYIDIENKSKIK